MPILADAQAIVLLVLTVAAFGLSAFALLDAVRRPAAAFPYADKRTKTFWTVLLVVASAMSFVSIGGFLPGLLGLIPIVAAAVYLVDVRPAVRMYRGGSGRGPYGGL